MKPDHRIVNGDTVPSIRINPKISKLKDHIRYDFVLSYPDHQDNVNVYYEVFGQPVEQADNFDGILYALVFHAMREGLDLNLAGPATFEALLTFRNFNWLGRAGCPCVTAQSK